MFDTTSALYVLGVAVLRAPAGAHVYGDDALEGLAGTVRFECAALDAWFEEDEEIFVHPRWKDVGMPTDVWMQHPTQRFLAHDMAASLRRWTETRDLYLDGNARRLFKL